MYFEITLTQFPRHGHYVLRHAQNNRRVSGTRGGQNKLPLGMLNRRLISYLREGITVRRKNAVKLEKAAQIGSNEQFEGVAGPETGQKITFSSKMTHALSIDIIKRSR